MHYQGPIRPGMRFLITGDGVINVTRSADAIIRAMLPKYRLQFRDEITQEIVRGKKGRKR